MAIENWKNKIIDGKLFNDGFYDESYGIFKLKELGFPYALASMKINSNEYIVIGCDPLSPVDFMAKNQNNHFILDLSKASRTIETMFGFRLIHYARPL